MDMYPYDTLPSISDKVEKVRPKMENSKKEDLVDTVIKRFDFL